MIRKIKNSTFNAIPNIRYLGHVWIIAVLSGYATVSTAQAATFYVGPDETYTTIQAGIEAVVNIGDKVVVRDGTYKGAGNKNLNLGGRAITVRSENGPANCIIDCEGGGNGFGFLNYETSAYIVDGFTIRNGSPSNDKGGGIYIVDSSPTIKNCIFSGNTADDFGGGIYIYSSSPSDYRSTPLISHCIFSGNEAKYGGGGIYNDGSSPDIIRCIFSGNFTRKNGGGIMNVNESTSTLMNCAFNGNQALQGGGVFNNNNCPMAISSCTFSNNKAISFGGGIYNGSTDLEISNSIIWGNVANWDGAQIYNKAGAVSVINYSDVAGGWAGTGNIDANPKLVFADDPHLQFDSPCIDKGTGDPPGGLPATDLDGNNRVSGAQVDMGACEFGYNDTPCIAVSPGAYRLIAPVGSDPVLKPEIISLRNCGGGVLNWKIAGSDPWLKIYHVQGESSGELNTSAIQANTRGLNAGKHTCLIIITDDEATETSINSPRAVTVTLLVGKELNVPSSNYPDIQTAIDAAEDGDTVLVADSGSPYTGSKNRNLNFKGKAITVKSENGRATCTIDCENSGRGFIFQNGEASVAVVDGFTIMNGHDTRGGGIYCKLSSSPTIRNCWFSYNEATQDGGGICIEESFPLIIGCDFEDNSATNNGGGIYNLSSAPTICVCTFSRNTADLGGGIYNESSYQASFSGRAWINDCIFTGNQALASSSKGGGGIYNTSSSPQINQCNFLGNTAVQDGGGIYIEDYSAPEINFCTFSENSAGDGGGIYNGDATCAPVIASCAFLDNDVGSGNGGGIYHYDSDLTYYPTIFNSIFFGNQAGKGGGIYLNNCFYKLEISNCTLVSNNTGSGSGIYCNGSSSPTVTNCIFWKNGADTENDQIYPTPTEPDDVNFVKYSFIEKLNACQGNGNIGAAADVEQNNPHLINDANPNGFDGVFGTYDDGLRIEVVSPCIDKGKNLAGIYSDLRGSLRPINGDIYPKSPIHNDFDMGAYEYSSYYSGFEDHAVIAFREVKVPSYTLIGEVTEFRWKNCSPFPEDNRINQPGVYDVNLVLVSKDKTRRIVLAEGVEVPAQMPPEGYYSWEYTFTVEHAGEWYLQVELTDDHNQSARSQRTFLIGLRQPDLYDIGEEIAPPANADASIKPEIEDDFKDSFFWSDYTGRLYPIEPVTAVITWTDQEGDPYPQLVSNIWPEEQIHVADAQAVDLLPAGSPYSFVEIRYADNDAQISGGSLFTATTEGHAVLLYGTNSNYDYVPQFEVVKTVLWNNPDHLEEKTNWPIGTEIEDPNHNPNCGSGYVYSPITPIVSPFDPELYDRDYRSGPIFPVNLDDPAWEGDDLIIFWYQKGISGADWPYKPMRYDPNWPALPEKIVIASQLGSEIYDQAFLDDTIYSNFQIYHQPDPELPGCNPNEEHACFFSSNRGSGFLAVYALRNDLNQGDWSEPHYTSEPYVLLKYQDSDENWYYRIFQVLTEAEAAGGYPEYSFVYDGRAGTLVQPPYPLSLLLPLCDSVSYADMPGPWWTDYNGKIWARHGGIIEIDGVATGMVRWFYPLQEGFQYDLDGDGEQDAQVTECIPWLDRDPSTNPNTPIAVTYNIRWPDDDYWLTHPEGGDTWRYVPELQVGETLLTPKNELPDIMNQCSVAIIFDEPNEVWETGPSVKLIDPLSERRVPLANLPDDISTRNDAGNKVFVDLPFHLRTRIYYDPINYELVFKGYFDDTVVGDPIVLLNIMNDREWEQLIQLSDDSDYQTAINDLFIKTQVQLEGQTELFGCDMALSAGSAAGTGYVTLAFSADSNCYPLPISVEVIKVTCPLYRGEIKVIESDNVFDERLTMRHSGDFGGEPEKRIFEWAFSLSAEEPNLPFVRPEDQWRYYFKDSVEGIGAVDITVGGAGLEALQDKWFSCRYTGYDYIGNPDCLGWSEWTEPQLHESWVKRVMRRINPFDQRFSDFHESAVHTLVSMIGQAGERYEGNVALNDDPDNLDNVGLIELYTTLFQRIKDFSIDGTPAVNDPLANRSLLFAASRIADLYMLLGNEAYADTLDPTIGFSTGSMDYGVMATTIFAFQDQLGSLLEEELALLRGLDGDPYLRPLYNRLAWNFTSGDGEVAYALIYNMMDQDDDGDVDEYDARILYPQGHGDAWGHYLTAIKIYYDLLRHPKYTWKPQCESVLVAGTPVEVDYRDERKFTRIAAAKAKTGAEIVNLTYRQRYVEDPEGQWQGYKDADPSHSWGLSGWASRAGQGAYLDWVIGNAILPEEDPNTSQTGIQKIDRTTVLELREVNSSFNEIQAQIDQADIGLNPLGIAKDAIPFDINPTELVNAWNEPTGRTHFEQIYDRAIQALNNTTVAFDYANQFNQLLRRQQDTLGDYTVNIADREADFNSRLIEIFGYPYEDDIGPTGTYATDYDGPDLYHYDYVDASELMGVTPVTDEIFTITFKEVDVDDNGGLVEESREVKFHLAKNGLGLVKPASWTGNRRAPGEIQMARSDLLQARARFEKAMIDYDNLLLQIEDQSELLESQYNLNASEILILNRDLNTQKLLNDAIKGSRTRQLTFRTIGSAAVLIANAAAEFLPQCVGLSTDVTAPARGGIRTAGAVLGQVMNSLADWESLDELGHQQAKEIVQAQSNIELTTLRGEYAALQQFKQLEQLIRVEASQRLDLYTIQENMQQAAGRYLAALARGERLLQDQLRFRQQTANNIQRYRYKDMAFRIFRNEALQKYRAQFDMAARYVYLAAKAYDYETVLLDSDTQTGQQFLTNIVRQRTLGQIEQGVPLPGSGLADVLARLSLNFDVLKGQLGFNNPQIETTYFSLRQEYFRILAGTQGNSTWRGELEKYRVDNLWDVPEFQRFCKPFDLPTVAEPALVIPFATNITSRLNFFGWPLGADPYYSPENFATKIRSVGMWFSNYNTSLISPTPRIYLVPIGEDILRTPSGEPEEIRGWHVVEQIIPQPYPIVAQDLEPENWIPLNDTVPDVFTAVRRHVRLRAYPDGGFDPSEMTYDSRLVGRSVWNTQWLLIIPGASLLGDPEEGLEQFINGPEIPGGGGERTGNGVTDIKLFFKTYAYSGY